VSSNERDFAATAAKVEPEAQRLIASYPAGQSRSALLPILHAFQNAEGWVSPEAMARAAEWTGVPLSVVESTASFYTLFHRKPTGKYVLQPCRNLSCVMNGAGEIMARFREKLGVGHMQTTEDGLISYEEAECLAACDRAPCMQVNLEFVYDLTTEKVDAMIEDIRKGVYGIAPLPQSAKPDGTWVVHQVTHKSAGARDVPAPDGAGGLGDAAGREMIERLERDDYPVVVRPTSERLIADGAARLAVAPAESNGSAH
jgi:NADH-quinone oxidoreductase subunit E